MAVTAVAGKQAYGVVFTHRTDSSADWGSVANDTYFYDIADDLVYYKNSGGTIIGVFDNGGSGKVGIADASGVYTYYADLVAAQTAAATGDTLELFTDLSISTKFQFTKSLILNGNGHKITMTGADYAFQLANNSIKVKLTGGLRIDATTAGALGINVTNANCILECDNSVVVETTNTNALTVAATTTVTGGNFNNVSTTYAVTNNGGTINRVNSNVSNNGIESIGGTVRDCFAAATGTAFNLTAGALGHNLLGYGASGFGIYANNSRVFNSNGISNLGQGCHGENGAKWSNCNGYSIGAIGWGGLPVSAPFQEMDECTSYSIVDTALQVKALINGGTFKSTNWIGAYLYDGVVDGAKIESAYNNASGHAIYPLAANSEITACKLKVVNATANCIWSPAAISVYHFHNRYFGATTPVNANVTNLQTNNEDAFGEIQIG